MLPMNPNKALWEKGDFTRIAATMRESGEALVQRLGITKGLGVLDLGCGDGTTALPAAKLGADVLGGRVCAGRGGGGVWGGRRAVRLVQEAGMRWRKEFSDGGVRGKFATHRC